MTVQYSDNPSGGPPLDRMELWENEDLLLSDNARACLEAHRPGASAVMDWPELRALFANLDNAASAGRKRRQRIAFTALCVAAFGALMTAVLPLVELLGGGFVRWTFAAAAAISATGLIWSVLLALRDPHRSQWLEHRMRTERLRQFHFQFLVRHFDLAAEALADANMLEQLKAEREKAIEGFRAWLARPMHAELTAVIADVNDKLIWQIAASGSPDSPACSKEVETLFGLLRNQRIGIQLAYVREKLASGFGSPESRFRWLQGIGSFCAIAAPLLSIAAAIVLFQTDTTGDISFRVLTSLIALVGLVAIFARALSEGLQLKADVARYHWYRDAVADLDARFHNPDPAVRLNVLFEMESLAYREMREFLTTHNEAGFNFG